MIEASNFKRGQCIKFEGDAYTIVEVQFSTPTARGASPIAKTKLRNLRTNKLLTESIRTSEKFEEVELEMRDCSYLYSDGGQFHFMDSENFEQFAFTTEQLGDSALYLKDGLEGLRAMVLDGVVVNLSLPRTVELEVTQTDPALKGATAQAQLKPATTETGLIVQVPPYLKTGERIRVDTQDGHFVERVKS